MKKKAILFDLDHTLYDEITPHKIALKEVHKVFTKHHKIGFEEFKRLFYLVRDEIKRELIGTAASHNRVLYFQRVIEKTHNTVDPTLILKLYDTLSGTYFKNIKPFPEAIPVLKELRKKGLKIAIVTNQTAHVQLRKLEKLGFTEYVDVLVTSEEAGRDKPHPAPFIFALHKMNLKPDEVMMVGDIIDSDIEGANAAGIDSVLIATREVRDFPEGDLRKPDHVIKNLMDLLKLVK
jgi:putative hydrolase of the HAD superfamily